MLTTMIFAKDHDAVVAFYREVFELSVVAERSGGGYTVLADDSTRLSVHVVPPGMADEVTISNPPVARTASAIKLLFEVSDVTVAQARVVELGGLLTGTPTADMADGIDVEGNPFRISSLLL